MMMKRRASPDKAWNELTGGRDLLRLPRECKQISYICHHALFERPLENRLDMNRMRPLPKEHEFRFGKYNTNV